MERNGRCQCRADPLAIEAPPIQDAAAGGKALLERGSLDARDAPALWFGNGIDQAGQRSVEGSVRHHGGNHRPHTDILVGLGDGVDALDRR